jgi:hypothetical protein
VFAVLFHNSTGADLYPILTHSGSGLLSNNNGIVGVVATTVNTYYTDYINEAVGNYWLVENHGSGTGHLYLKNKTSTVGFTGTHTYNTSRLAIGGLTTRSFLMGLVCQGVVSDSVRNIISENPWQIFKPRIARFISIPSTGTVTFKPAWARSRSLIIGSGV